MGKNKILSRISCLLKGHQYVSYLLPSSSHYMIGIEEEGKYCSRCGKDTHSKYPMNMWR